MLFYNVILNSKKMLRTHRKEEVRNYLINNGFDEDVYGIVMVGASYVGKNGYNVRVITEDRHFRVVPSLMVNGFVFEKRKDAIFYLQNNCKYNSTSEMYEEIGKSMYGNTRHITHIDVVKDDFDMSDVRFFIKKCKHYYTHCGIGKLVIETKSRKSRIVKVHMTDNSEEITVYLRDGNKDILHSGKEWYVFVRWMRDNVLVNTIDIDFNYIGG